MAQPRIPDKVVVNGDWERGIKHKGRAHTLLSVCRRLASGLNLYKIQETQDDGCVIYAQKIGAFSLAEIVVPDSPKKEKRDLKFPPGTSIILGIGTENDGYFVQQIGFDGQLLSETDFPNLESLLFAYPRSQIAKPLFKNRITLSKDDPSVLGVNTLSEASWLPECEIPNPHCPLAPGSGTIECSSEIPSIREAEGEPRQAAVYRFHRRQYCTHRLYGDAFFEDKRDFVQITENAGWRQDFGPLILVPLSGDDVAHVYSNVLSISCLRYEKRFYCSPAWADTGERGWDDILSGDQIYFTMEITPAGPAILSSNFSSIEYDDYLYGALKWREDTGEPWFVPWDDELLNLFLQKDLMSAIYPWNRPLPGLGARIFRTPLRMAVLESGAPDFSSPSPGHSLAFSVDYAGMSVHLYARSFLEGTFDKLGTVGTYTQTETRHLAKTAAAVFVGDETFSDAKDRNENLRMSLESFFFRAREKQVEAGLEWNQNIAHKGNLIAYIVRGEGEEEVQDFAADVFFEINRIRLLHDLPILSYDADLEIAAMIHAIDCAQNALNSHTGSDGSSPIDRVGRTFYQDRYELICEVGENVAFGQTWGHEAVLAWVSSPPHWANIINPDWTDTAVVVWPDENGQLYWVQVFGRRDGQEG